MNARLTTNPWTTPRTTIPRVCCECGTPLDAGERCDCALHAQEAKKPKRQAVTDIPPSGAGDFDQQYEQYMRDFYGR